LPVWYKFHVDSLFRSEDIEKRKKERYFYGYGAIISGKSGKPDF